jgi:hypothetical protein
MSSLLSSGLVQAVIALAWTTLRNAVWLRSPWNCSATAPGRELAARDLTGVPAASPARAGCRWHADRLEVRANRRAGYWTAGPCVDVSAGAWT